MQKQNGKRWRFDFKLKEKPILIVREKGNKID